jgi:hypothetical protein
MKKDNKKIPLEYYYAKYQKLDPAEAAGRTGLEFDRSNSRFILNTLGYTIYAEWPEFKLIPASKSCPKSLCDYGMEIITIRYIIEGRDVPSSGSFKSYRELPWGEVYNDNFQGRCIKRFAYGFGYNVEKFEKAAEALSGIKLSIADASYDFVFMANVICRLFLWKPDEEFGPSAQFLFSDNTQFAFNAEDLAAVGDILISALKEMKDAAPYKNDLKSTSVSFLPSA